MNVIARKKQGVWIMYGIVLVLGGILFIAGMGNKDAGLVTLVGLVFIICSLIMVVPYFKTPVEIIKKVDEDHLLLLNEHLIDIKDMLDISYTKATTRGLSYKWGKIIIKTKHTEYKLNFVADCEAVSKYLTKLMYESK